MSRAAYQREYRKKTNNQCTKKYEKTPKGYLVRKYRNMLSRVKGIQYKKAHLYEGLKILDKQIFYDWALNHDDFNKLFNNYVNNNYDRKLAPTVDRINPRKGYTIDNMQWLTHSENSQRTRRNIKNL